MAASHALSRVPTGRSALIAQIELRGWHRRRALRARISTVIATFQGSAAQPVQNRSTSALLDRLASVLTDPTPQKMWFALAVITGRLPLQDAVLKAIRTARLDGPLAALAEPLTIPAFPPMIPGRAWPTVRVISDRVIVDVHDTARTEVATGIQRVARQTAQRWDRDHDVTMIGWTADDLALRELNDYDKGRALGSIAPEVDRPDDTSTDEIIVPWRCQYLLPELIAEPKRNHRLQSLLRFSGNRGASIGFDLVPLTSAETVAEGMGQGFSTGLAAATYMTRIATISNAAATEYLGWREMLAGTGLPGPAIEAVSLATEAATPSAAALDEARSQLLIPGLPMVLCVGSHEPRKNHLAVVHAAELLWREGIEFSLLLVGGNAWHDDRFVEHVEHLQNAGRPIVSVRALPDDLLWAAYQLAHCLIFPSLNEGFGLPIAESLAHGTPVITSSFGSMREIVGSGGAILVNPRDDHDVADGLRRMLTDSEVHEALSEQARGVPIRSWDEYADRTWRFLVDGVLTDEAWASAPEQTRQDERVRP